MTLPSPTETPFLSNTFSMSFEKWIPRFEPALSAGQTPTALQNPASTPMRPAESLSLPFKVPQRMRKPVCSTNQSRVLPRHAKGVVHLQFPGFDDPPATPAKTPGRRDTGPTEIYWGNGQ